VSKIPSLSLSDPFRVNSTHNSMRICMIRLVCNNSFEIGTRESIKCRIILWVMMQFYLKSVLWSIRSKYNAAHIWYSVIFLIGVVAIGLMTRLSVWMKLSQNSVLISYNWLLVWFYISYQSNWKHYMISSIWRLLKLGSKIQCFNILSNIKG